MMRLESRRARRRDNNRKGIQEPGLSGGRRVRGTVGRNYFYFVRQPARPRHEPYEQVESARGATGDGERRMARMAPSCW